MPDADMEMSAKIVSDSAFGCAGQRCLAVSVAVTVADSTKKFNEALLDIASGIKTGDGLQEGTTMGPVITQQSKERILQLVDKGVSRGGKVLLDGREFEGSGNFIAPTIISGIDSSDPLMGTEIFGPVLTVNDVSTLDDAIATLSQSAYGNSSAFLHRVVRRHGSSAMKHRPEI